MQYTKDEEPLRVLNERGWNLYAIKNIHGNSHGGFNKIVENGLVVPFNEFLRREQEGDTKEIQVFGWGPDLEYLVYPVCDEPNSPAAVNQRAREVRKSGGIAALYTGGRVKFRIAEGAGLSLDALPVLQNVSSQS